jgi:hypothetical protein
MLDSRVREHVHKRWTGKTGKQTSAVERSCNRMHAHIRASANAGTHRHTHTHTRTQHTHMANEIGESRERELMGAEVGARNAGKGGRAALQSFGDLLQFT